MTREEWLIALSAKFILPLIAQHGGNVDYTYRISIGFPHGRKGRSGKAIGQCWPTERSADKTHEIFIHPEIKPDDIVAVAIHEHIHASVGLEAGHKAPFKKLALAVGLEGKMTATVAGAALKAQIAEWLKQMPAFPGAVLKSDGAAAGPGSRLVKVACSCCGYTIRSTAKWLSIAIPSCPNGDCREYGEVMAVKL